MNGCDFGKNSPSVEEKKKAVREYIAGVGDAIDVAILDTKVRTPAGVLKTTPKFAPKPVPGRTTQVRFELEYETPEKKKLLRRELERAKNDERWMRMNEDFVERGRGGGGF